MLHRCNLTARCLALATLTACAGLGAPGVAEAGVFRFHFTLPPQPAYGYATWYCDETSAAGQDPTLHCDSLTGGTIGPERGTEPRVEVALCGTEQTYVARRNVAAALNRRIPTPANIDASSADRAPLDAYFNPNGAFDFEDVLLHEVGHAVALQHTFHSFGGYYQGAGADGIWGTEDDTHEGTLDEFVWFPKLLANNNPFLVPDPVDQMSMTYRLSERERPGTKPWAPSVVVGSLPQFNVGPTWPMTTNGHHNVERGVVRRPAPDDLAMLALMEAGPDGVAGTGDDYRLFFFAVAPDQTPPFGCVSVGLAGGMASTVLATTRTRADGLINQSLGCFVVSLEPYVLHECYGRSNLDFNRDKTWYYTSVDTSNGEGDYVPLEGAAQPVIEVISPSGTFPVPLTYVEGEYHPTEVTVRVSSHNGEAFAWDSILGIGPQGTFQADGCEFGAESADARTVLFDRAFDLGGLTEAEIKVSLLALQETTYCQVGMRVTSRGAGVFLDEFRAEVIDESHVFGNGFEP